MHIPTPAVRRVVLPGSAHALAAREHTPLPSTADAAALAEEPDFSTQKFGYLLPVFLDGPEAQIAVPVPKLWDLDAPRSQVAAVVTTGALPIPAAVLQLGFAATALAGAVLPGLVLIVAGVETVQGLPDLQPAAVFGRLATSLVS